MKHTINGCPINLRTLSVDDINRLISEGADRLDRVQDEMDSLHGELVRRNNRHLSLVPSIVVPPYLRDPA